MKRLSLVAAMVLPCLTTFAGSGQNEVTLPNYYGYGSGSEDIDRVHVFTNIVPLYNVMPQKAGNISATGGGLGVQLELGAKVPLKIGRGYGGGSNTFLSFSLGYQVANIKTKYTDAKGDSHDENGSFDKVVVPIAIGGLLGRDNGRARFFWQGGVSIAYMGGTSHNALIKDYEPLSFAPFVSLGFSGDGEIKRGPLAGRNAKGMVGPFFAYTVNNMASASNATANNFTVGIQFTTVFL